MPNPALASGGEHDFFEIDEPLSATSSRARNRCRRLRDLHMFDDDVNVPWSPPVCQWSRNTPLGYMAERAKAATQIARDAQISRHRRPVIGYMADATDKKVGTAFAARAMKWHCRGRALAPSRVAIRIGGARRETIDVSTRFEREGPAR
jgi:hypothetical protein